MGCFAMMIKIRKFTAGLIAACLAVILLLAYQNCSEEGSFQTFDAFTKAGNGEGYAGFEVESVKEFDDKTTKITFHIQDYNLGDQGAESFTWELVEGAGELIIEPSTHIAHYLLPDNMGPEDYASISVVNNHGWGHLITVDQANHTVDQGELESNPNIEDCAVQQSNNCTPGGVIKTPDSAQQQEGGTNVNNGTQETIPDGNGNEN